MGLIQSGGELTGAAASLLSAMSAGTWFQLSGIDYQLVTVSGQTPAAGKVFACRLSDGDVVQLDDTQRPAIQYSGTFSFVSIFQTCEMQGIAPAADTLGDVALGGFFDTGAPDGIMGRKVEVFDGDGVVISPGVGNAWRLLFNATQVTAVATTTEVESYSGSVASAYRLA